MLNNIHKILVNYNTWMGSLFFLIGAGLLDTGTKIISTSNDTLSSISLTSQYLAMGLFIYKVGTYGYQTYDNKRTARKLEENMDNKIKDSFTKCKFTETAEFLLNIKINRLDDIKTQFTKLTPNQRRTLLNIYYAYLKKTYFDLKVQSPHFYKYAIEQCKSSDPIILAKNSFQLKEITEYLLGVDAHLTELEKTFVRGTVIGILATGETTKHLPTDVTRYIGSFFTIKDTAVLARICKDAVNMGEAEVESHLKKTV